MKTYSIHQLKRTSDNHYHRFVGLEDLNHYGLKFEPGRYEKVYEAKHNGETLEELYEIFNIHRPEDFMGHSMSVSDLIVFSDGKNIKAYFVDSFGFKEVPFTEEVMI